jgi:hypothetical protein
MKYTAIIIILIGSMLESACVSKKLQTSRECELMDVAIRDIMAKDSVKNIMISREYWKWDIDLDFYFKLKYDSLPKTQKERMERLQSNLIDPYPSYYIFAYPITDSIFTNEDREFIKEQIRDTTKIDISCNAEYIKFVSPKEGMIHGHLFFKPLFSKNHKYAIIRRYEDYLITESNSLSGESQTLYYKYDRKSGWVKIFTTPVWQ